MTTAMTVESGTRIGVGFDTARFSHHVTFLRADLQPACEPFLFAESSAGYKKLAHAFQKLAERHPGTPFQIRIDAAGQYAVNLEAFLRTLPYPKLISVGEPARNRRYREAVFPKRKADPIDSRAMARFALNENPSASPELPAAMQALREIASRLESQARQSTRLTNQLHNLLARVFPELALFASDLQAQWVLLLLEKYPTPAQVARARLSSLVSIPHLGEDKARQIHAAAQTSVGAFGGPAAEQLVANLVRSLRQSQATEAEFKDLLIKQYLALPQANLINTICGIGDATAAILTAKIVDIHRFASPAALVNYFGAFPEEDSSGTDKQGRPKSKKMVMSRKGNDLVRKYLWLAAGAACQHNPAVRALYRRLAARGVAGGVAIGHCMGKMLHLVFAVWKSGKPFDPKHYPWENGTPSAPNNSSPAAEVGPPAPNENAVGHRREQVPTRKVVTTATARVDPSLSSVNVESPPAEQSLLPSRPRIDFSFLRQQVSLEQVLRHLNLFDDLKGPARQRRGHCPFHQSDRPRRTLSVHLGKNAFHCFQADCQAQGNALDFWARYHRLPIYDAALHLAATFDLSRNREEAPVKCPENDHHKPQPNPTAAVITADGY